MVSGLVHGLGFGVEGFALSRLSTNCHEALDAQSFACRLNGFVPLANAAGILLLGASAHGLGDHPATAVLHELVLGQASRGLRFAAPEHDGLGSLPLATLLFIAFMAFMVFIAFVAFI